MDELVLIKPFAIEIGSIKYNLVYCYAHEDKNIKNNLEKHLSTLIRQNCISVWSDKDILPGTKWEDEINKKLAWADFILLLISPDFIHSEYCYSKEMKYALQRHEKGEAHVIPIIIRPVDWQGTPIKHLQVLPTGEKPITEWRNKDTAFQDISRKIRYMIEDVNKKDHLLLKSAVDLALKHKKLSIILVQQNLNTSRKKSIQILRALKKHGIIDINYNLNTEEPSKVRKGKATQSKYALLALWLQSQPLQTKTITLSFKKIEEIIGVPLPPSARTRSTFWSNNLERNPQARQWSKVGWQVSSTKINDGIAIFSREEE